MIVKVEEKEEIQVQGSKSGGIDDSICQGDFLLISFVWSVYILEYQNITEYFFLCIRM